MGKAERPLGRLAEGAQGCEHADLDDPWRPARAFRRHKDARSPGWLLVARACDLTSRFAERRATAARRRLCVRAAMIQLAVAGWRIRLDCTPVALDEAAATRYAPFLAAGDGPVDLAIAVTARPGRMPAAHPGAIQAAALVSHEGGYRLDAAGIAACIQPDQGRATLELVAVDSCAPAGHLEYFLRVACALVAFRDGGLLLHAAGLVAGGRAHLFTGVSGSGKSTVTALSTHATALSDDLVLLRPAEDGWVAHGTPFWNPETASRAGQTASAPVAGIFKLVKAPDVWLQTLSLAAAAAELAANCPVVNGRPELLPALLARCRSLACAVPVQRLHFRKDASFWEVVNAQEIR